MKRLLILMSALLPSLCLAIEPNTVNRSSCVAGPTHTGYIASQFVDKVIVGVTTSGGSLELYNSTWQAVNLIASMTLVAANNADFSNMAVQGIFYKATNPTNTVTILYKR
jgi:hypothetical protein